MSWLYTLIFAGLAFSSSTGSNPMVRSPQTPTAAAIVGETEHFDKTYPFNPTGKVDLNNLNGSIVLDTWDRNEVRVEYTKTVDSKERLSQAQVRIDARPEALIISTEFTNWPENDKDENNHNFGRLNVDFHITLPRTAVLNNIEAVNGTVTLSKFTNFVRVAVVNGQLIATNLSGTSKLSTVNGELRANLDKLEPGSQISLETVMGSVTLVIPSDSSAVIKANTLNGAISNDLGLPVRRGKYVGQDLYGRMGNGEVPIRLNSVNGGLVITHRNDGRQMGPVTNLLNMKGGDDADTDVDVETNVEVAPGKVNKEINKAMKDSQKVMKDSVKKVDEQMKDVAPNIAELNKLSVDLANAGIEDAAKAIDPEKLQKQIEMAQKVQWDTLPKFPDWDFGMGMPKIDESSDSFPVTGTPKITIDAPGCSVSVRTWDKQEVQYRAVQYTRAHIGAPVVVGSSHTDSGVTIRVNDAAKGLLGNTFFGRAAQTRIEVFVPQKSDVKIGTTGEIRVEGVTGTLDLSGLDETVNVRDSSGTLRINNGQGRVRVIGFRGDVNTNTSEGDISLEGTFTSVVARSAEGNVLLTLPAGASADIESNCPDVRGNGIRFDSVVKGDPISKYKLGSGGAKFQIWTEGNIEVRGADTIKASL